MGGGLMQLVAYGAQDIYLTGNPQITFFKVVYRRHTNFSMESIEQTFTGTTSFGGRNTCVIARNGDLVHKMYLELDITGTDVSVGAQRIGHNIIDYVEIEIGGQLIDKQYGQWMDIWAQLSHSKEQYQKLNHMITGDALAKQAPLSVHNNKLYVPLQFWFNRNPGLALPLIALQYHEVKLNLKLNKLADFASACTLNDLTLYCDYIFLDTDERRRFAQVSHEYLIEQVQFNGNVTSNTTAGTDDVVKSIDLRFNHPCKELVWVAAPKRQTATFNRYSSKAFAHDVKDVKLELNGHDRFTPRDGSYFRTVQSYQHHTGGYGNVLSTDSSGYSLGGIYSYSFALRPEEHQPSGTCNFSRIDNSVLSLTMAATGTTSAVDNRVVSVYATNYNVLRIMSGMGGLAYSN